MKKESLGLLLFRIGLGGVFLLFGIDKFFHPVFWAGYIPQWFTLVSAGTLLVVLGIVEAILGAMVLVGFGTRFAASISALMLLGIIISLGYNEIMVRDAGLLCLALGIAVLGAGEYSFDRRLRKV